MKLIKTICWLSIFIFLGKSTLLSQGNIDSTKTIDGYWLSEEYGFIVSIQDNKLKIHEFSKTHCAFQGESNSHIIDNVNDSLKYLVESIYGNYNLLILPRTNNNSIKINIDNRVSNIDLKRIIEPEQYFAKRLESTSTNNFKLFYNLYKTHYAFFDERNIDWDELYLRYQEKVNDTISSKDLYKIMCNMLEPLQDRHTFIIADNDEFNGRKDYEDSFVKGDIQNAFRLIDSTYLVEKPQSFCNSNIEFGLLENNTGYLRLKSLSNFCSDDNYNCGLKCLKKAMDMIINKSQRLKSLIIDLRLNSGGYDGYAIEIAKYMTETKFHAFSKKGYYMEHDSISYTSSYTQMVEANELSFSGNIILLTGRYTVSAAEVFALSLSERKPFITTIGENTQGVFSDELPRILPNGWVIGLSNEVYTNKRNECFEGIGISPNFSFDMEDMLFELKNDRDIILEKALEILKK